MLHYTLYQKNPASHYIYIDLVVSGVKEEKLRLQLPSWRPGRYELGNFAKNIKRLDAFNGSGEMLGYRKLSKDLWEIDTKGAAEVKVTYSYYAAELNAGSCYADETQLYVNPIHCCMFYPLQMDEEHRLELKIPGDWKIACSMKQEGRTLIAETFDELADSPFIAAASIQSDKYEVAGITFHLQFNGECAPDFDRMKTDFAAFTRHQVEFWKGFPFREFHFLFQVLPYKFYHGVEHKRSTVIAIGPGYAINSGSVYEEVLGVSSHELFHVWNVKTIRPAEMLPYDFSRENHSPSGFVYEGFTTYYGDKHLLGSGVFDLQQYFTTLEERLTRHFHNYGRYNLGVADSSWDTWLDGYSPGAPYRKTSIYDEGCLIAFMLDVKIMRATGNRKSLRDLCRLMWLRFGNLKKGYAAADIVNLANEASGTDLSGFFDSFVFSAADFEPPLLECFSYLGIEMQKTPLSSSEYRYGFKIADSGPFSRITLVAPYSPAWKAGLFAGDEIIAVNGTMVRNNLNQWIDHFSQKGPLQLSVSSNDQLKTITLDNDRKGQTWFFAPKLKKTTGGGYFDLWSGM